MKKKKNPAHNSNLLPSIKKNTTTRQISQPRLVHHLSLWCFLEYTPVWQRQRQKNLQILTELYKLNRPHLSQSSRTQMHVECLLSLILRTADLALIQELSEHTC